MEGAGEHVPNPSSEKNEVREVGERGDGKQW